MLYHLASYAMSALPALRVIEYVTIRAILGLGTSFIIMLLLGNRFIEFAKRHFRSKVREYTPEQHQVKNNTPTMGGVLIGFVTLLGILLWNDLRSLKVWLLFLTLLGYGLIGFFDDWLKITSKRGISAKQKFVLQWGLAGLLLTLWYVSVQPDTNLYFPLFKQYFIPLGIFVIPWGAFVVVSTSNAVNLTDGLDGLAGGVLVSAFYAFGTIAYFTGHFLFSTYLHLSFAGTSELVIIASIIIGALLGFLWYNAHPAQLFMGDVGSLMLGATLGFMAIMTRQELLLPLAGGIFVLETLSVMLQVASYRLRGKRIFKMAPIHHHFELSGVPETAITTRFWIVGLLLALLTLFIIKIR